MKQAIHISKARALLDSGATVDLKVCRRNGQILELRQCRSLRYDFLSGTRRIKILASRQIRTVRDCLIVEINGQEVFL